MGIVLRYRKLKGGVKSYYLDINALGKRMPPVTLNIYIRPTDSPAVKKEKLRAAEALASKREINDIYFQHGLMDEKKLKEDFFTLLDNFIANYQKQDIRKYQALKGHFRKFYGQKSLPCIMITPKVLNDFNEFLERGLNASTPSDYMKKLKHVLKILTRDNYFLKNPADAITIRNNNSNQIAKNDLTQDELQIIYNTPFPTSPELKRQFLFCSQSGMGWGESTTLRRQQIEFTSDNEGIIRYQRTKKGKRKVEIDLSPSAIAILGDISHLKPDDLVFTGVSKNTRNKLVKKLMQAAGITKHITFHCARHSAATNLLATGLSTKEVGTALGHTSTQTTDRYSHLTVARTQKKFRMLKPLITAQGVIKKEMPCNPPTFFLQSMNVSPLPEADLSAEETLSTHPSP